MKIAQSKFVTSALLAPFGIRLDPLVPTKKLNRSKAELASYRKLIMPLFKIKNTESLHIKHLKSISRSSKWSRLKELFLAMAPKQDSLKSRKSNQLSLIHRVAS